MTPTLALLLLLGTGEIDLSPYQDPLNERVQLSLTISGDQSAAAPDIQLSDFQVQYSGPSRQMSIINGQMSQSVTHTYLLTPTKQGTFTLGPFEVQLGGKRYDLAFVFGFDKPLVSYAIRVARHVVAFEQGVDALDQRLLKRCTEPPFQSIHAVEVLLRLSDAMHIPRAGLGISYRVSDAEKQWANRELAVEMRQQVLKLYSELTTRN